MFIVHYQTPQGTPQVINGVPYTEVRGGPFEVGTVKYLGTHGVNRAHLVESVNGATVVLRMMTLDECVKKNVDHIQRMQRRSYEWA